MSNASTSVIDISNLPRPEVKLLGNSDNAFAIIGSVQKALRRAGWTPAERDAFAKEAMAGDYDHVLQTCMKYTDVC